MTKTTASTNKGKKYKRNVEQDIDLLGKTPNFLSVMHPGCT